MGKAVELSKESRAALRASLKDQLAVVRKKVRTMRAKNFMGLKDDDDKKEDSNNDAATRMADGKTSGGGDHDHRQGDRSVPEKAGQAEAKEGTSNLSPEIKAQAEAFFQRGNRPVVGKTKSVVARIMTNEQKSFTQDSRPKPPKPKEGKKK